MKLLDTNIVVYAVGRPHRYKQACIKLLKDVASAGASYNADTELIQEVLYLYTARGERVLGLTTCADLLLMFPNPFAITRDEIILAHELLSAHANLVPRDAIHAAVVLTNHLEGIVSADRVFDDIEGIRRIDPLEVYPEDR